MIHLDTNFLIRALQTGSDEDAKLRAWLEAEESVGISAVTWAEFLCGPLSADDQELAAALLPVVEPLTQADSVKGAEFFNATGRRPRSLADCLIAAAALRLGARIATRNLADFEPFVPLGLVLA